MLDEIVTNRLILRVIKNDDASDIFERWASNEEVTRYMTWNPHKEINETKEMVNFWLKEYEKSGCYRFVITLKEELRPIGMIDIVRYFEDGTAEVGYCLGKNYWNKGYMTEAANAFVEFLFNKGINRVLIEAVDQNIGSNKVIQKLGFKYIGSRPFEMKMKGITYMVNSYVKMNENFIKKNKFFDEIHNYFGFGCMRLPMLDSGEVDEEQFSKMIEIFLNRGFNYFDTAHGYIDGKSELALNHCLTSKYPREKYLIADKLTGMFFEKEEDVEPFINSQLKIVGVDYFDFYLMHCQNKEIFNHFVECKAYEAAFRMKKEGKLRHVGFSFHDDAEFLDKILTTYPEVDFVQIQFNYLDYLSDKVQSKKCYDVCLKHGKPVIVMEPVKGGTLAFLPHKAADVFKALNPEASNASYALRFVRQQENVMMVLSGMSDIAQTLDNTNMMVDPKALNEAEMNGIKEVIEIINSQKMISCTGCRYCVSNCPKNIAIPDLFSCYNEKVKGAHNFGKLFKQATLNNGKPSECLKCGQCEQKCPQKLSIRSLLVDIAKDFE